MHAGGEEIRLWSLASACLITNDAGARADHRLPAVTLSALRVETSYSTYLLTDYGRSWRIDAELTGTLPETAGNHCNPPVQRRMPLHSGLVALASCQALLPSVYVVILFTCLYQNTCRTARSHWHTAAARESVGTLTKDTGAEQAKQAA